MRNFVKVMKALSEPNRLKIIKMLEQKECCVCEIQEALGIAQPTVSKHQKDGLWVNYSLSDGRSSPYAATLMGNLKHWLNEDSEIKKTVRKIPYIESVRISKRS
jgi:ArsR family transcriptional regulator